MVTAATVYPGFWGDKDYRNESIAHKILFLFLVSYNAPSGGAISGVYEIATADMAHWTGLPLEVVEAILDGREVKVSYEIEQRNGMP